MSSVGGVGGFGFHPQTEQAAAIDSGLDSISTGIQSAAKNSGLAEVSAWIDAFSTSATAISEKQAGNLADSSGIQSPDSYFKSALGFGGEAALQNFSDLVPMDEVSLKLADPAFDQQQGLQRFSTALSKIEVPAQPTPQLPPEELDSSSMACCHGAVCKVDSAAVCRDALPLVESEGASAVPLYGVALTDSQAAVPYIGDDRAPSNIMFIGDVGAPGFEDSTATLTRENSEFLLQNAGVFQRLTDLQDTLKTIANLNQQTEGQ